MLKLGMCRCCSGKVSNEAKSCPHCGQPDPYSDIYEEKIQALLRRGEKIQAIKLIRDMTGCGLKEAKDYVDALERC